MIDQPPEQVQGYRFESVKVKEPILRIDGVFCHQSRLPRGFSSLPRCNSKKTNRYALNPNHLPQTA
ncbi:MAG: DUF2887 domain-containing protein [Chroococcidiopsidaceae cyanobacterium CP_BM_ER_R8_30]|nr:DUF2887 domain-containing protein [Chroococcidiopsidaceae cyanobacterium CP_BM_ER_R8_30]